MNEVPKKLSVEEISENIEGHVAAIGKEFRDGFEHLRKTPKSVTIFGSSMLPPASPHYQKAKELAERISKETGYAVVTGGGPGIMAAANLGAHEVQGTSIGYSIRLPHEQQTNPYVNSEVHFKYFFARKAMLIFSAEVFVFFPGGYGTFDELFMALTLVQTGKIPRVPIILVGKDFWKDIVSFIKHQMLEKYGTIGKNDLDLFILTDSVDEALTIIKKAPVSEWWNDMD